jgi:hypothetical protein
MQQGLHATQVANTACRRRGSPLTTAAGRGPLHALGRGQWRRPGWRGGSDRHAAERPPLASGTCVAPVRARGALLAACGRGVPCWLFCIEWQAISTRPARPTGTGRVQASLARLLPVANSHANGQELGESARRPARQGSTYKTHGWRRPAKIGGKGDNEAGRRRERCGCACVGFAAAHQQCTPAVMRRGHPAPSTSTSPVVKELVGGALGSQ